MDDSLFVDSLPPNADKAPDDLFVDQPHPNGMTGQLPRSGIDVLRDAVSKLIPNKVPDVLYKPQAMTNALPTAGGAAMSLLGPGGMTAGAMIGTNVRDAINAGMGYPGAPQTSADVLKNWGAAGLESGAMEVGASLLGKAWTALKNLKQAPKTFEDALQAAKDTSGTAQERLDIGADINQDIKQGNLSALEKAKRNLYGNLPVNPVKLGQSNSNAYDIVQEIGTKAPSLNSNMEQVTKHASDLLNSENLSSQELIEMRSKLNNIVHNGSGLEVSYARRLVNGIEADLQNLGPEWNAQFNQAKGTDNFLRQMTNNKLVQKFLTAAPDALPDAIFSRGYADNVNVAKAVLDPETFQAAKGRFFNKLISNPNITQNLAKLEPEFLRETFQPQEISSLQNVGKLQTVAKAAGMTIQKLINLAKAAQYIGPTAAVGYGAYKAFR